MLDEDGSAVVESVFAIFVLMFMTLGLIQIALTLYARNVVMAAAHDGARAAVVIGPSRSNGAEVARGVVQQSAGSMVEGLEVSERFVESSERLTAVIVVSGRLSPSGPIPFDVPISIEASASREVLGARR